DLAAGPECLALIDRTGRRLVCVAEIHLALPGRLRAFAPGEARKAQFRALADHGEPDIDHLDRLVGRMVSIAMLIERVERDPDAGAVRALDLAHANRHLQREFLADIA